MASEHKPPKGQAPQEKKRRLSLRGIFYHNTFVLIFSLCAAIIAWFVMTSQNTELNRIIRDVPIEVTLSPAAEEDGIRVFNQSYNLADLEISGSSLITNKLSSENFQVTALLNPTSTKLTGNTMQKITVPVRPVKRSSISDYNIVSFSPGEITLEYDRYKEATFSIEQDLKYSADNDFYPGTVSVSAEKVVVSGPESSVNKISRAAISFEVGDPLRADASFTCPVRLYDQNNQELTDTAALYLSLDVDTVDVSIPILSRKTVDVVAATVHQPKGFSDSRITVTPAKLDIAGPADVLATINEITLDTPIDFAELEVSSNNSFEMDIPLPAGVRNINAVGENTLSKATVSINLNGYRQTTVQVSKENFQISNKPAGRDVVVNTQLLDVTLVGSDAQISKLTGDSILVQIDLANSSTATGNISAPATVAVTGAGSDSCWVLGRYTVSMTMRDTAAVNANGTANFQPEDRAIKQEEDPLVATPQE